MIKCYRNFNPEYIEYFDPETYEYSVYGVDGEQYSPFRRDYPFWVSIEIATIKKMMTFETFKDIFKGIGWSVGIIRFVGNYECYLNPDFDKMLDWCHQEDIAVEITISGANIDNIQESTLVKMMGDTVYLTYSDKPYFTAAFQKLKDKNIFTIVSYVINKETVHKIENVMNEDILKDISCLEFAQFHPKRPEEYSLMLDAKCPETTMLVKYIEQCVKKYPLTNCMVNECFNSFAVNYIPESQQSNMQIDRGCDAARFSAHITVDKWLMPCQYDYQKRFAAPITNTLKEVFDNEKFDTFRSNVLSRCTECVHKGCCGTSCQILPQTTVCRFPERT